MKPNQHIDMFLEVTLGNAKGQSLPLGQEPLVVGRQETCALILPDDPLVSRRHAHFGIAESGPWVENLGSLNGVYVNQKKIEGKKTLQPGDEIIIGNHQMILKHNAAAGAIKPQAPPEASHQPPTPQNPYGVTGDGDIKNSAEPGGRKAAAPQSTGSQNVTNLGGSKISSQNALRRLYLLYQLNRASANRNATEHLLTMILNFIFQDIRVSRGTILLLNREANQLQPVCYKIRGQKDNQAIFNPVSDVINLAVHDKKTLFLAGNQIDASLGLTAAFAVPLMESGQLNGIIYLDTNHPDFSLEKSDAEFLEALGQVASVSLTKSILEETVRRHNEIIARLEKHVGSEVAQIAKQYRVDLESSEMATEEREVTILFSDIVGFTSMSERLSASEIAFLLNGYFNHMADCVTKHHGYLNKYIGDAVMAVFGAPNSTGRDAENAVHCGMEMLDRLEQFWLTIDPSKRFKIRLGINTGTVIAGNIGSISRMEYTVIGDSVNLASRLESKANANTILIGESTYQKVKNLFKHQALGTIQIKGKQQAVNVYQIIRAQDAAAQQQSPIIR